jgi:hypothetical protein
MVFVSAAANAIFSRFGTCGAVNESASLDLVLNGNKIIDVYVDARGGAEETATQTLPLVLKKGDMVWVRTHERYTGNTLYGNTEWNRGTLIYHYLCNQCLSPLML